MKILLLTILLLSFGQAQAQLAQSFYIGSELLERCEDYLEAGTDKKIAKGNVCMSYIAGIEDVHAAFAGWKLMYKYWCTPDKMVSDQLVRVVVNYLQKRLEQLHLHAGSLVANALDDAFPCGGES